MNERLKKAVIRQLECEPDELSRTMQEISMHGADTGWCGFTHYSDTTKFFKKHRTAIVEHTERFARDLGESVLEMICSFRCLKHWDISTDEVARVLYGKGRNNDHTTTIQNAMSWFILEEVAKDWEE